MSGIFFNSDEGRSYYADEEGNEFSLDEMALGVKREEVLELLKFYRDRLVEVYGESVNVDFILKGTRLIKKLEGEG